MATPLPLKMGWEKVAFSETEKTNFQRTTWATILHILLLAIPRHYSAQEYHYKNSSCDSLFGIITNIKVSYKFTQALQFFFQNLCTDLLHFWPKSFNIDLFCGFLLRHLKLICCSNLQWVCSRFLWGRFGKQLASVLHQSLSINILVNFGNISKYE